MPLTRLVVGLAFVVAGAAGWLWADSFDAPPTAVLEGEPAAVDAAAADPLDLSANNSPVLARNPTDAANVVLAHRVDQPRFDCRLHVSVDDATTWQETTVPQPPDSGSKCYAPNVAFGADGTLFVSYVVLAVPGNMPNSVWVASSTDGGRTLSKPRQATGPRAFQVNIVAHPGIPDHLALTWLQAADTATLSFPEAGYPIVTARSEDGGRTWTEPVQVSAADRSRVLAPASAIGVDGEHYVLYLDVRDDRLDYHGGHEGHGGPAHPGPWELVVARSTDGGRTWSERTVDDELVPIDRYLVFLPPLPSLAVAGGRLYAAFHDQRGGDADVWLWTSGDAGQTWSEPLRVNDNGPGDDTSQHLPQLAVAPNGRLDVVYYDRRADPDDRLTEVSLQSSADGGATFTPRLNLSDVAFNSGGSWSHWESPERGSRLALLSDDEQALAAWADMRADTLNAGEQDIYHVAVAFPPAQRYAGAALRIGGVLLGVVGAAVLGRGLRLSRGRR